MRFGNRFLQIEIEKQSFPHMLFFSKKLDDDYEKKKCILLYEIADDMHWLMLTDVKHIKKSVLCAQGNFVRSLMSPMSKQRI